MHLWASDYFTYATSCLSADRTHTRLSCVTCLPKNKKSYYSLLSSDESVSCSCLWSDFVTLWPVLWGLLITVRRFFSHNWQTVFTLRFTLVCCPQQNARRRPIRFLRFICDFPSISWLTAPIKDINGSTLIKASFYLLRPQYESAFSNPTILGKNCALKDAQQFDTSQKSSGVNNKISGSWYCSWWLAVTMSWLTWTLESNMAIINVISNTWTYLSKSPFKALHTHVHTNPTLMAAVTLKKRWRRCQSITCTSPHSCEHFKKVAFFMHFGLLFMEKCSFRPLKKSFYYRYSETVFAELTCGQRKGVFSLWLQNVAVMFCLGGLDLCLQVAHL